MANTQKAIPAGLTELVSRVSSETFDLDVYRRAGCFVVRGAIPAAVVREWQAEWDAFYQTIQAGRDVNKANPVALAEQPTGPLAEMYREPALVDVMRTLFGEHVALYNHRFVIKDRFSTGKVFLHQDSCYHLGNVNKCSFFVPLTHADKDNGAMTFHVGSHRLGFLGDAGEINPDSFEVEWPKITPELSPGDFVVMNSALWHESGPNTSGRDRVLADTIVQPADDPTGEALICGEWQTDIFFSHHNCIRYFANSRVLRNMRYEKELASLREAAPAA
ncbi:phytanoyl-CoA dioxygenase family protein [Paraburkholderia sp. CNPSo 3076]|uniref:phytanoyl-CoA dioxygenase family protein n=1 Tax=Paraburkholderia sp. CNPSo 3076 TaxID=2940936 RepID=UPI0022536011|nr:phytanoyl-CoA dioxygenase family protein [Paraburkholderia sp. CNPSo 3076]MCX5541462.1 phytanoyl-CoA dioxygenase family protein [Paraburkholderia sp. CNPSo 3076]